MFVTPSAREPGYGRPGVLPAGDVDDARPQRDAAPDRLADVRRGARVARPAAGHLGVPGGVGGVPGEPMDTPGRLNSSHSSGVTWTRFV